MKAELLTGEIVDLEKDCSCMAHDGPHWIHDDRLWRRANQAMPRHNDLACLGFIVAEQARLQEKAWRMERLGIRRLLDAETD